MPPGEEPSAPKPEGQREGGPGDRRLNASTARRKQRATNGSPARTRASKAGTAESECAPRAKPAGGAERRAGGLPLGHAGRVRPHEATEQRGEAPGRKGASWDKAGADRPRDEGQAPAGAHIPLMSATAASRRIEMRDPPFMGDLRLVSMPGVFSFYAVGGEAPYT